MKPTYIDLLRARYRLAATLNDMWQLAAEGKFDFAMWSHFEYMLARDECREIAKHIDWMESNRLSDAYLIADGLAQEFRM